MKKLMFAVVAMALSGALWADSYAFTYQAALRNEHGGVLDSRNHAVTIRLWNAPTDGTLLWSRSFNVMTDANGLFNLAVSDEGSKVPLEEKAGQATLASVFAKQSAGDVFIGLKFRIPPVRSFRVSVSSRFRLRRSRMTSGRFLKMSMSAESSRSGPTAVFA